MNGLTPNDPRSYDLDLVADEQRTLGMTILVAQEEPGVAVPLRVLDAVLLGEA